MQRGQILIFVLLGLVMIGFLGVAFYAGKITPKPPSEVVTSTPSPIPVNETLTWKTYTNAKYGFSFKYDPTSELSEEVGGLSPTGTIISLRSKNFDVAKSDQSIITDNEKYFELALAKLGDDPYLTCSKQEFVDETKKTLIANLQAHYKEFNFVEANHFPGYTKDICLENNGFIYIFSNKYYNESSSDMVKTINKLFDNTLSTFKFLK